MVLDVMSKCIPANPTKEGYVVVQPAKNGDLTNRTCQCSSIATGLDTLVWDTKLTDKFDDYGFYTA
jgi:hypothetical protein